MVGNVRGGDFSALVLYDISHWSCMTPSLTPLFDPVQVGLAEMRPAVESTGGLMVMAANGHD